MTNYNHITENALALTENKHTKSQYTQKQWKEWAKTYAESQIAFDLRASKTTTEFNYKGFIFVLITSKYEALEIFKTFFLPQSHPCIELRKISVDHSFWHAFVDGEQINPELAWYESMDMAAKAALEWIDQTVNAINTNKNEDLIVAQHAERTAKEWALECLNTIDKRLVMHRLASTEKTIKTKPYLFKKNSPRKLAKACEKPLFEQNDIDKFIKQRMAKECTHEHKKVALEYRHDLKAIEVIISCVKCSKFFNSSEYLSEQQKNGVDEIVIFGLKNECGIPTIEQHLEDYLNKSPDNT